MESGGCCRVSKERIWLGHNRLTSYQGKCNKFIGNHTLFFFFFDDKYGTHSLLLTKKSVGSSKLGIMSANAYTSTTPLSCGWWYWADMGSGSTMTMTGHITWGKEHYSQLDNEGYHWPGLYKCVTRYQSEPNPSLLIGFTIRTPGIFVQYHDYPTGGAQAMNPSPRPPCLLHAMWHKKQCGNTTTMVHVLTSNVANGALIDCTNTHLPEGPQIIDPNRHLCSGLGFLHLTESIRFIYHPLLNDDKLGGLFWLSDFLLLDTDVWRWGVWVLTMLGRGKETRCCSCCMHWKGERISTRFLHHHP